MKKKALSLLLAGAVALSMSAPALASETSTVEKPGETASTELEGTIKATQLVVTVPANVQFELDPTKDASSDPTAQVQQPEIKIKNSSVVPVYVSINKVSTDGVTLVNDVDDLDDHTEKNVMFALSETGNTRSYETANDWLMGSTDDYSLNSTTGGKIAAVTRNKGQDAPGEMELKISARATLGWEAGDTFTITPTFIVKVQEPKGEESPDPSESTEAVAPSVPSPSDGGFSGSTTPTTPNKKE